MLPKYALMGKEFTLEIVDRRDGPPYIIFGVNMAFVDFAFVVMVTKPVFVTEAIYKLRLPEKVRAGRE